MNKNISEAIQKLSQKLLNGTMGKIYGKDKNKIKTSKEEFFKQTISGLNSINENLVMKILKQTISYPKFIFHLGIYLPIIFLIFLIFIRDCLEFSLKITTLGKHFKSQILTNSSLEK